MYALPQERFWQRMLQATLPLVIWGVHFFFCYIVTAEQARFNKSTLLFTLAGASLLALLLLAMLCWRTLRRTCRNTKISLLDWASASMALLAGLGVMLTCLPMLLLSQH